MAAVQNTTTPLSPVKVLAAKSGSRPGLAIGLMVLAVGLFAVMDAMEAALSREKFSDRELDPETKFFVRLVFKHLGQVEGST